MQSVQTNKARSVFLSDAILFLYVDNLCNRVN